MKGLSRLLAPWNVLLLGSEALVIVSVMWAAVLWQHAVLGGPLDGAAVFVLLVAALCQLSLYSNDWYMQVRSRPTRESFLKIVRSIAVPAAVVVAFIVLSSQYWVGGGIILALGVLPFALISWRTAYMNLLRSRTFGKEILLMGDGRLAKDLVAALGAEPDIAYTVSAGVPGSSPSGRPNGLNGQPLLKSMRRSGIDHVVIAFDDSRGKLPVDDLLQCKFSGIKIEDGLSFYEHLTGKVHLDALKPSWLIFSDGFRRPRAVVILKRVMDVVGSLVGLVAAVPLAAVLAALIKLDSPGPVLYRQERVGKGGRSFMLIKFRSMRENAEAETGPVWATDDDRRVTRVGKWLRKFRLDELPQMMNVLRGEMSFVGPRPERPWFVDHLKQSIPYYNLRHAVKPGITGWAQVRYRYGSSVQETFEKLQYDFFYIKNMSAVLDLTILVETVKTVMAGRGWR
jgi:sugar transferase (PEP-CTERM system associated)